MLNIQTSIQLPDFAAYPDWNPFITQASGDWAEGNTVSVTAGGMSFKPKVLTFAAGQELRWKGKLLFNGIFDGEHYFILTSNGDGTTKLEHGENFSGLLVPAFRRKLETDTKTGFEDMNKALVQQVRAVHNL